MIKSIFPVEVFFIFCVFYCTGFLPDSDGVQFPTTGSHPQYGHFIQADKVCIKWLFTDAALYKMWAISDERFCCYLHFCAIYQKILAVGRGGTRVRLWNMFVSQREHRRPFLKVSATART